jgi:SAM-dependent methyltransferase
VIATDIAPLAQPRCLWAAIHYAIPSIVRDTLSAFCEHSEIRSRLDRLLSIKKFSLDVLKELGIEYIAPLDMAKTRLGIAFDFVYSNSVLEHVPVKDVPFLLQNLVHDLREGGIMIHGFHLEDHKDILNNPFGFLSETEDSFCKRCQSDRGNRIRRSQWRRIFGSVPNMDFRFLYEWSRQDKKLPKIIDRSISHEGEHDLRVSHIAVLCTKRLSKEDR